MGHWKSRWPTEPNQTVSLGSLLLETSASQDQAVCCCPQGWRRHPPRKGERVGKRRLRRCGKREEARELGGGKGRPVSTSDCSFCRGSCKEAAVACCYPFLAIVPIALSFSTSPPLPSRFPFGDFHLSSRKYILLLLCHHHSDLPSAHNPAGSFVLIIVRAMTSPPRE